MTSSRQQVWRGGGVNSMEEGAGIKPHQLNTSASLVDGTPLK